MAYGDPLLAGSLQIDINLIGPEPIRNIRAFVCYEPGFSLDVLADVTIPIGEYDNEKSLNFGQNRWYGRAGAHLSCGSSDRGSHRRTTLEFLPSLWLFGDNNDFVGRTLSTEPMIQIEGAFKRDLVEQLLDRST